MKRFILFLLAFSLFLSGCSIFGEHIKDPVTFYYLRTEYQYGTENPVIVSEEREASGHLDDLSYLMALYLMGPSEDDHVIPLPRGTRITFAQQEGDTVALRLTDLSKSMTEAEFSLACACLSLTCLDITGAQQVTITSGDREITMSRSDLILFDNSAAMETTEETQ